MLRSGSRRRAVLTAHSATCDMFLYGADRRLRVYNPKAPGPLRCVQRLRPQLLDEGFCTANPGFWQEPPHEQARLAREVFGEHTLDLPYEVVEVRLNASSSLLALVGVHRVAVVVLPPIRRSRAKDAVGSDVSELLSQLGLDEYTEKFHENGHNSVRRRLKPCARRPHPPTAPLWSCSPTSQTCVRSELAHNPHLTTRVSHALRERVCGGGARARCGTFQEASRKLPTLTKSSACVCAGCRTLPDESCRAFPLEGVH